MGILAIVLMSSVVSAQPRFIDPTGTYRLVSKSAKRNGEIHGRHGELRALLLDSARVAISLHVSNGAPAYNSGSVVDTIPYARNTATYRYDSTCTITITLYDRGKSVRVSSTAPVDQSVCGFGWGVRPEGRFRRVSRKAPAIVDQSIGVSAPVRSRKASPTGSQRRIVRLEETIRAGIDRDAIDSIYVDGELVGCVTCAFNEGDRAAYDEAWNEFLNKLMSATLEKDVAFSELILRAYFSSDGRLDYLLFHVGGDEKNNRAFVAAAEKVQRDFRFAIRGSRPFKQSASISLGAPVMSD
jgi:hypothetical protein